MRAVLIAGVASVGAWVAPAAAQPRQVAGQSRDVAPSQSLFLPSPVAATPVSVRENDVRIDTALSTAYDDNIFRTVTGGPGRESEIIVAPRVGVTVDRVAAGAQMTINGQYGYEVFTRHPDRSRPRLALGARGTAALVATCGVTPYIDYRRERTDFGDINAAVDNTVRQTRFGMVATCQRPAGFYPLVAAERYQTQNDDRFDYADQRTRTLVAGVGYRRPSLGQALAYYRRDDVARPTSGADSTVDRFGLALDRAVSPLLSANVDLHWLSVNSADPQVVPYDGLGWRAQVVSRALAPIRLEATAARSIVFDTLLTTAYAIESAYGLSGQAAISELSSATLGVDWRSRDFRAPPALVRNGLESDRTLVLRAGLARRLSERLQLRLDATHTRRASAPAIAEFDATRAIASAELRF